MIIKIYDCPTFSTSSNPERGEFLLECNSEFIDLVGCIFIYGNSHGVFRRVYNVDENQCELWVKGKVKKTNHK